MADDPQLLDTPHEDERMLDPASLKALGHPLRMELYTQLYLHGPATASGLAARLGESSGATSYHLRQLERHGFVEDDPEHGDGRDRWWRRVRRSLTFRTDELREDPAAYEASLAVSRQVNQRFERQLDDFLVHSTDALGQVWTDASRHITRRLDATVEELAEIGEQLEALSGRLAELGARGPREGTRPVLVRLAAFPVLGGDRP